VSSARDADVAPDPPVCDPAFLVAEGVSHAYAGTPAVTDVDLSLPRGSLTCLIGPTGCGKTTLLRSVAGFITPDSGRIRIGGRDVTDLDPARRGIGFVYQDLALFSHMSVRGNVGFGLRARRVPAGELRRRVADMLARVGLEDLGARRPGTLSGGQRQRVALARALVFEPDILLLDEPFAALDKNVRAQMQQEVRRLQRQAGITTVLVTHDQQEALKLADVLVIMKDGRIEQVGPPRELYHRPASLFAARFLGDANLFPGRYRSEPDRLEGPRTLPVGHLPEGLRDGQRVTALIRPEDVVVDLEPPRDATPAEPTASLAGTVAGTVTAASFSGALTEARVRPGDGGPDVRVVVAGAEAGRLAVGTPVWLSFPRDRLSLIPEEPT